MATTNGGLDDTVSPVFGRCQTFTFVEVKGEEIKDTNVIQNQYAGGVSGVGIQAGQFIVQQGATAAIAGNFGPNVSAVLSQAGVEMIFAQGNVRDILEKYLNKELSPTQPPAQPQMPFGMGMGRGMGRGTGRGMGMGRGLYGVPQQPFQSVQQPMSKQQEVQMLEQQIKNMEQQLGQIKKRLKELKK